MSLLQDSPIETKRKRWTRLLAIVSASVTIGLYIPVGYNIGVVNSPASIIQTFCKESIRTRYDTYLSVGQLQFLWSAIVSVFLVGGAIGSLTGSWLADYIGRKGASIVSGGLSLVAAILFLITKFINSVESLILGRLIVGLSAGLTTCTVPMYLIELAPNYLSGIMGVFCQLGVTFGVLIAQVLSLRQILGTEDLWPYLLSFYAILVFVFMITIPVLPESPKYLLFKKKRDEALKQLARIRNEPQAVVERVIMDLEMQMQIVSQQSEKDWNLGKVLFDKSLLLPLVLVISMQAGQQMNGINAVFYYSTLIFQAAGLSEMESQFGTIGAGVANVLMACVSIYTMSRFKRRVVMQLSCISSIICLIILIVVVTFMDVYAWLPYICIATVLAYVISFGIALGPVPYFIGSELFEVGPRPSAMALGSMANWGGNFVVGLTFPLMQDGMGAYSFIIFVVFTAALFLLVRFYLPETKGRDPSEVALLCKNGFRSRVLDSPVGSAITVETVPVPGLKV